MKIKKLELIIFARNNELIVENAFFKDVTYWTFKKFNGNSLIYQIDHVY